MNEVYMKFINDIEPFILLFIKQIEIFYPDILSKTYEAGGEQTTFLERMQLCLYIELIKAGYLR